MTTFPTRRTGQKGRKGSNQFTVCTYSIPKGSLEWWIEHLDKNGIPTGKPGVRFGQRFVGFEHPDCGIEFEVLEDEHDTREPYASPYVPIEHAQRGFHSWTDSVRELEDLDFFMNNRSEEQPSELQSLMRISYA